MPVSKSVWSNLPQGTIKHGVPSILHSSSTRKKYVISMTSMDSSKSCLLATISSGLPRTCLLCIIWCRMSRVRSNGALSEQSMTKIIPNACEIKWNSRRKYFHQLCHGNEFKQRKHLHRCNSAAKYHAPSPNHQVPSISPCVHLRQC